MYADGCSIGIAAFSGPYCKHIINGMQVDIMDCSTIEQTEGHVDLSLPTLGSRLQAWFNRTFVHSSRLDLEAMPDRVKRDLGFLDGRDPPYEGW